MSCEKCNDTGFSEACKCKYCIPFVKGAGVLPGETSANMNEYRQATSFDYAFIVRLLTDGDEEGVMIRSLFRSDKEPYPLLEISKGPYKVSENGFEGFSVAGESCLIRITDTPLHNVEIKQGNSDWIAPEMGSIILLIPK